MDLSGQVAIVTGASSGIGAAVARRLAAAGMKVALVARSLDRLEAVAAEARAAGGVAQAYAADVTREDQVEDAFAAIGHDLGFPDLLVNNAGIADKTPLEELTLARWQEVLDINLTSAFLCSRAAVRLMKPRRRGRILMVGSISALTPREDTAAYTASKFALDGLTRAIALDGRGHGITAGVIRPGSAMTNLVPGLDRLGPEQTMRPEHVADLIHCVAAMPAEVNVLESVILPIGQPFLGRG
ncbi:SDR family oxidoreductase [Azospirillum sp. B4]|uniref:SDR family oxidoreductase n=1 Tax=Azospirillum sp. B4 TaxID=95605 RepID=UPI0005CA67F2|nr:SDR family oxidoreductase [Azospirillum sp. B4]